MRFSVDVVETANYVVKTLEHLYYMVRSMALVTSDIEKL